MITDEGQTNNSRIEQQKRTTMTALADGNGGHRRERRQHNTSISTGGNTYKKEPFETEQRKASFKHYDPQSKATMTMSNTMTAYLSGSLNKPAVSLVPQSHDSKGTTATVWWDSNKEHSIKAAKIATKATGYTSTATTTPTTAARKHITTETTAATDATMTTETGKQCKTPSN
jgi:hypothetical protein